MGCSFSNIFLSLPGCTGTPQKLTRGEFSQQVLEPLTIKLAPEFIELAKANYTAYFLEQERQIREKAPQEGDKNLLRLFGLGLFGPGGGWGADKLIDLGDRKSEEEAKNRKTNYEEQLLWLDSREILLKNELLELYQKRVKETDTGYSVCISGKEQMYGIREGRFIRLADGDGPCPTTKAKSLERF